jgi:hypothetical protein
MHFIDKLLTDNSHVHIDDKKKLIVEQIICSLINDGRKMLHVVADFDFTLTVYERNGVTLPTTFGVIEANDQVTVRIRNLLNIYYCIHKDD